MEKKYLKVGTYVPETEENEAVIQREYYRQGWIFKDEAAFLFHADQVCYVPELSDGGYTRQDFMALCNGCPETWVDEQYREDEWGYCPECEKIYDMAGEVCACPVCGWNPEEEERNGNSEGGCRAAEPGGVQPEAGLEAGG